MATNNMFNASPPLPLSGGTMTGDLFLNGSSPTNLLELVSKDYADSLAALDLQIPFPSNNWYWSGNTLNNLASSSNIYTTATGTLNFTPFYVVTTTTFQTMAAIVNSGGTGNVVFGMYNDNGNCAPTGSPIVNTAQVANPASGLASAAISSPISLDPGVYWCAMSTSATNTYRGFPTNLNISIGLGFSGTPSVANLNATNGQIGWRQAFTYSSTLPTVGTLTASVGTVTATSLAAYVWVRAQ